MTQLTVSAARLDNICIVMMSALGDAVHVLPVAVALKRARPQCRITWILQPGPAALVRGHPAVDEIILFERSRGLRAFAELRQRLSQRTFNIVLDFQVYLKASVVTAMVRAPIKLGFDFSRARDLNWLFTTHRIPARPLQHVQDQYFEFLHELGIAAEPVEWKLGPWDHERFEQRSLAARFDRPLAAIVVATSKPEKDWIPERWAEVCDALAADFGLQPVLVGGATVRERAAERIILENTRVHPHSELGSGVRPLVTILAESALVLSPDTGPLHMAVALNTPVISLMGYSNPKRTGPYRRFHELIVDAYGSPGESYQPSMENRPGRMRTIRPRDVLEKVEVWKRRYSARDATRSSPLGP